MTFKNASNSVQSLAKVCNRTIFKEIQLKYVSYFPDEMINFLQLSYKNFANTSLIQTGLIFSISIVVTFESNNFIYILYIFFYKRFVHNYYIKN